jgi:hypothetical protein
MWVEDPKNESELTKVRSSVAYKSSEIKTCPSFFEIKVRTSIKISEQK